ncbi:MAG: hypothetical protein GX951_03320 [Mollicutes bacterium]|nr:hypothetical protein [Mollicutes bacterium]
MSLKSKIILGILLLVLVGGGTTVYFLTAKKEVSKTVETKKEEEKEKEKEEPKNTCPEGYTKGETKCRKEVKFTYNCQKGEKLENGKCVKTIIKDATMLANCPEGSTDIKLTEYCGKDPKSSGHTNNPCPEGTLKEKIREGGYLYCYMKKRDWNPPYDTCGGDDKSYYFETSTSICYYDGSPAGVTRNCNHLPGTTLYDNKCYTTVAKDISYTCPSGYTKDNNKCYLYEKKNATKICPKDYVLENDKCVSEVPFITE